VKILSPKLHSRHFTNSVTLCILRNDCTGALDILVSRKAHFDVPGLSSKFEDDINVSVWEWFPGKIVFQLLPTNDIIIHLICVGTASMMKGCLEKHFTTTYQ